MPEILPSCFGDYGQHAQDDMSNQSFKVAVQSSVICLYQPMTAGFYRPVSVTWCKGLLGQGFTVSIDEPHIRYVCKVDLRPWHFWRKQGSKTVHVGGKRIRVFWDLSDAKYACGAEPQQGFYVVVVCEDAVVLSLGDLCREAYKKNQLDSSLMVVAALLSKKEHLFGRKVYNTRAQFEESGSTHDIAVECHVGDVKEPWLCVRIDKQAVVHITHLVWKFRGNQTIHVDGLPIEVLWDVHDWLFNPSSPCAVFMFRTYGAMEKHWMGENVGAHGSSILQWPASHSFNDKDIKQWCKDMSFASLSQWPNTCSFKGVRELRETSPGFSLLLYAWRRE